MGRLLDTLRHLFDITPMRRFLIYFILLCTFGSSMAWALDRDSEALSGHVASLAEGSPDAPDSACIDHFCCHGAAHLVGLLRTVADARAVAESEAFPPLKPNFASTALPPPSKPPKA